MYQVNFKSGTPVYLQLVDQVRYAAASGALRAGDTLPAIRTMAEELRINRNTVAKAYWEMERLGIIESIPGKGCFLKENGSPLSQEMKNKILIGKIDEAVVTAHQTQTRPDTLKRLVEERIQFFERKKNAAQPEPTKE